MSESELERSRRVNARPSTKKPLSDEEIDKLIQDYKIGEFSGFYIDKAMTESMYARYNKVFAFVRAIEERHGIK